MSGTQSGAHMTFLWGSHSGSPAMAIVGIWGGGRATLIGGQDQNGMEMLTFAMFFSAVSKQNKEMRGPEPLYGTVADSSAPSTLG